MDLSVIIPVYNASRTLAECIDSVVDECAANLPEWELILVDDGSTDGSAALIASYAASSPHGSRIRLIRQPNGGVAKARNTGLRAALGRLIAFNDSDDRWLPGRVALQRRYFADHPETELIGGLYGEDGRRGVSLLKLGYDTRIGIRAQVLKNYFSPPTVIFRAEVLERIGLFDERMRHAEDAEFFHRAVIHCRCVFIAVPFAAPILSKMRWGESGLSGDLTAMERGELRGIAGVYRGGFIPWGHFAFACGYSAAKFVRRWTISQIRKIGHKPTP